MRDLNFLLFQLALCHGLCPPTNRRKGYTIVSLNFSDHFLWFLSSKLRLSVTVTLNRSIAVIRSRATLTAPLNATPIPKNLAATSHGKHFAVPNRMSGQRDFLKHLNVICPVQPCAKKNSA
jgi:hypothetical protein